MPKSIDEKQCIGIDLGTSKFVCAFLQSKVCTYGPEIGDQKHCLSSVVHYSAAKSERTRAFPANRLSSVGFIPQVLNSNDVYLYDTKRFFGKDFADKSVEEDKKRVTYEVVDYHGHVAFKVGLMENENQFVTPFDIAVLFLKEIKKYADSGTDSDIRRCVITHPVGYNIQTQELLKRAANEAGFDGVNVIEEPTAACISYLDKNKEDGYYLVYDFGGGTLDICLLERVDNDYNVLYYGGSNSIGGCNIDNDMYILFLEELEKIKGAAYEIPNAKQKRRYCMKCKELKEALSSQLLVEVDIDHDDTETSISISRTMLNNKIRPLINETIKLTREVLNKGGISKDKLKNVLLTGGTSKIPLVSEMMEEEYINCVKCENELAEFGVVKGAYLYGIMNPPLTRIEKKNITKEKEEYIQNNQLKGIPHLIGALSYNVYVAVAGTNSKVLHLPIGSSWGKRVSLSYTSSNNDTTLRFNIYTGQTDSTSVYSGVLIFEMKGRNICTLSLWAEENRYICASSEATYMDGSDSVSGRFCVNLDLTYYSIVC